MEPQVHESGGELPHEENRTSPTRGAESRTSPSKYTGVTLTEAQQRAITGDSKFPKIVVEKLLILHRIE